MPIWLDTCLYIRKTPHSFKKSPRKPKIYHIAPEMRKVEWQISRKRINSPFFRRISALLGLDWHKPGEFWKKKGGGVAYTGHFIQKKSGLLLWMLIYPRKCDLNADYGALIGFIWTTTALTKPPFPCWPFYQQLADTKITAISISLRSLS